MLKSIAQVKTFVNEVVNAESTAHILSNRGRNMRPPSDRPKTRFLGIKSAPFFHLVSLKTE